MRTFLTKKDVAMLLRVSARTVDNWCKAGLLPFVALPAGKRFDPAAVETFIRERSFGPKGNQGSQSSTLGDDK